MSKLSAHPGIVVGVDGSPASKVAVQWAARDAELRTVPLTLVHVVRATAGTWLETPLLPEWMRGQRERGRQVIDDALKIVDTLFRQHRSAHVIYGAVTMIDPAGRELRTFVPEPFDARAYVDTGPVQGLDEVPELVHGRDWARARAVAGVRGEESD